MSAMSRFAEIRTAMKDRRWNWAGWLVVAVILAAVLVAAFGRDGILLALVAWVLITWLALVFFRPQSRLKLSEIGILKLEVADCERVGTFTKSGKRAILLTTGVLFGLALVLDTVDVLPSFLNGQVGWRAVLLGPGKDLLVGANNCILLYSLYRNALRLLVTDQGLFLTYVSKPFWRNGRNLLGLKTGSWVTKFCRWEQIARFHWSRQRTLRVLHLNIVQPGNSVPQLSSYQFPRLSDAEWRQFDELLRKNVSAAHPVAQTAAFPVEQSGVRLFV
jgi:hypothetical protein